MKNRYTTIRFVVDLYTDYGTGFIIPVFASKKIVINSTRRFNNNMHKTASLPSSARNLLDFIIQRMNKDNEIENSYLFKQDFLAFMRKDCGIRYEQDTVNKGFQLLKKADLLISFGEKRSVYIVNPLYFFNSTESNRKKLLQKMLNATPDGKYRNTNLKKAMDL